MGCQRGDEKVASGGQFAATVDDPQQQPAGEGCAEGPFNKALLPDENRQDRRQLVCGRLPEHFRPVAQRRGLFSFLPRWPVEVLLNPVITIAELDELLRFR
jgi:hypothetical protein